MVFSIYQSSCLAALSFYLIKVSLRERISIATVGCFTGEIGTSKERIFFGLLFAHNFCSWKGFFGNIIELNGFTLL